MVRQSRSSLEATQSQLNALKSERDELVDSNNALHMKTSSPAGSRDTSPTERDHLQHYIDESKKEKRGLVSVRKSKPFVPTFDRQGKNGRHWSPRFANYGLQALPTSSKSRLSQQLRLAQDETATITSELTSKFDEYARYRRTKHAKFERLVTIMEEREKLRQMGRAGLDLYGDNNVVNGKVTEVHEWGLTVQVLGAPEVMKTRDRHY
ncbi:hypothetical protein EDC04DRAFT_3003768 [Pisolithus marmoratus]|nr:hypothetical protein EDC04DRAFT_3003768 [Pisolithus marmoratus]